MTFLLLILAASFAAFCVWLTVRIVNRRERWAKWTLAAVVTLAVYPLSMGPFIWLYGILGKPKWMDAISALYTPVVLLYAYAPEQVMKTMQSYFAWWER